MSEASSATGGGGPLEPLTISAWFWNPHIWLPPNVTWESFQDTPAERTINSDGLPPKDGEFAQFTDLWYPIPMAIMMMVFRLMVEKYFVRPLGSRWGLKETRKPYPRSNTVLEDAFRKSNSPKPSTVALLSKETNLSEIEIQRWFRQRKQAEMPSTMQKFCETGWRMVFYTGIFAYGLGILWSKHWFWDISGCWADYPKHKVSLDVWMYYMLELAFYWSLCFSQFFDVKRKDFWEMFLHHVATIALIMFSWTTHFVRMGTLVMIVHDCSDPLLELAKLLRYANHNKVSEAVLVVFTPIWVISRCVVFPGWILQSTIFDALRYSDHRQVFPAYYIFNGLLIILQCLHIFWTYLLFKAIHRSLTKSGSVDDVRSDSEESDSEDNSKRKKQ